MRNTEKRELFDSKLEDIKISREDYQRLFEQSLELIRRQKLKKELTLETLDQYTEHLNELAEIDLSFDKIESYDEQTKEKIKSFLLFSTQTFLINENARLIEELKHTTKNYEELLNLVTHEFKNILSSIFGYNKIIKKYIKENQCFELQDNVLSIDRLTQKMYNMVESLLKMSQYERGSLKLEKRILDFTIDILEPVEDEMQPILRTNKVKIVKKINPRKIVIIADMNLLQVVVRNILENAVKYGRKNSEIILSAEVDAANLIVRIKNFGRGIPRDIKDSLFEKFQRGDVGDIDSGTGIGLFNVRRILLAHDGEVSYKMKENEWVEFKFTIPVKLSE